MKNIALVFFAGFLLSACGGGGGGIPMTPPSAPAISHSEQTQLIAAAAGLRAEVAALPSSPEKSALIARIESLEKNISSLQKTLAQLTAEIARLQAAIQMRVAVLPTPPLPTPPTIAECNNRNMILDGGVCRSCTGTTPRRDGNQCLSPLPTTPTIAECNRQNMILDGNVCRSCTGQRRNGNQCLSPDITYCTYRDMILDGSVCRSCTGTTSRRVDNQCYSSAPGVAECNRQNMILDGNTCRSCTGTTARRDGNQCLPPVGQITCGDGSIFSDQSKCQFRTQEYGRNYALAKMNAAFAYEQRYFGQGVTVIVEEGAGGVQVAHEDLAANAITMTLSYMTLFAYRDEEDRLTAKNGPHGTWVAGIIAAARNGVGGHGVAPSAKFIPISRFAFGLTADLWIPYINKFPIINKSYGFATKAIVGSFNGVRYLSNRLAISLPSTRLAQGGSIEEYYKEQAKIHADAAQGGEAVHVYGAGNAGWQGRNAPFYLGTCSNQNSAEDCDFQSGNTILTTTIGELLNGFNDEVRGALAQYNISAISPLGHAYYPQYESSLEKHWLVVIALNQNDEIAEFSNGCGAAKRWCLAAPGTNIYAPSGRSDNGYVNHIDGTSFSAPHVSGALAVLKSARPNLPMKMIRAILLTTARDLGASGIDELYGWGLPDLEAGIKHIENLRTPLIKGLSAVKLSDLQHEFPARFAHLREKMSALTVAIEITDGAYYNMPLADIIPPQSEKQINFGNAAEEMLTENAETQKSGFAAFGDSATGFGLHWNDTGENAGMWAELSYTPKTAGIVGAETAAKIGIRRPLFGGIFAFGEYGGGFAKAQTGGSGYISAAENIKTEEWTAGVDYLDLLQKNDKLRFAVRQGKRIAGGKIAVSLPVAAGDFYKSFLGEKLQDLEIARAEISLAERAPLIFSAGYSVQRNKSEWAAAAEYAKNGKGKLSAKWHLEF